MEKKKILLCSPRSATGGISQWTNAVLAHYGSIANPEVEVEWFFPAASSRQTLTSTPLPLRLWIALRNYLPLLNALRKKLKSQSYDVLHLSTSGSLGLLRDLLVARMCRKRGVALAVHYHFGRISQIMKSGGWEKRLLERVVGETDANIVMDAASYEALTEQGVKNVVCLPNPLSEKVVALIGKQGAVARVPGSLLFAGHVLPTKGVFELVEACRDIDGIRLEICGICPDETKRRLLETAGDRAGDWLTINGNHTQEEVIDKMLRCGIFVLPSYTEGFPNVILESMACGCPIVSTHVGAIDEMLAVNTSAPCGITVNPRSAAELKEAILSLLTNPSLAKELGERSRKRVSDAYSVNRVWTELAGVWKGLPSKNSGKNDG